MSGGHREPRMTEARRSSKTRVLFESPQKKHILSLLQIIMILHVKRAKTPFVSLFANQMKFPFLETKQMSFQAYFTFYNNVKNQAVGINTRQPLIYHRSCNIKISRKGNPQKVGDIDKSGFFVNPHKQYKHRPHKCEQAENHGSRAP